MGVRNGLWLSLRAHAECRHRTLGGSARYTETVAAGVAQSASSHPVFCRLELRCGLRSRITALQKPGRCNSRSAAPHRVDGHQPVSSDEPSCPGFKRQANAISWRTAIVA